MPTTFQFHTFSWVLLVIGLQLSGSLLAQNPSSSLLHFDKPYYVSGETMYYRLFLPPVLQQDSLGIRVSVHDAMGEELDYFFLQRLGDSNFVEGYYRFPFDTPSSWYQFLFITIDANSGRLWRMARAVVPVYNDLRPPQKMQPLGDHTATVPSALNELRISITPDLSSIQAGEAVEATVQITDARGKPVEADFSVAVTDWELVGNHPFGSDGVFPGDPLPDQFVSAHLLFEIGYVKDELGDPLETSMLSAYDPFYDEFIYTETTPQGLFALDMPFFYGSKSIQFIDFLTPDIQIELSKMKAEKINVPLPYTADIRRYCELSRLRKKMYQLYRSVENPLLIDTPVPVPNPLRPGRKLIMEEYVNFPDLATFFREVNTPLKFRKRKKEYYARMFNPATQDDFVNNPLFRIGDQLTQNADFVGRIPMSEIDRIELFFDFKALTERYLLHGRDGLVVIYPHNDNLVVPASDAEDIFLINGLQAPPISVEAHPAAPVLRPQVYWQPQQKTSPDGRARIRFKSTDDRSRFRIQIVAQSKDGKRAQSEAFYGINQ